MSTPVMRLCNYRLINAIVFPNKMLVECKYNSSKPTTTTNAGECGDVHTVPIKTDHTGRQSVRDHCWQCPRSHPGTRCEYLKNMLVCEY